MNQLNHYEVLEKFKLKNPIGSKLYFVLSGIEFPDNVWHFIRLSAWLWLDKIILHNCIVSNKAISVWRNVNIEIIELNNILDHMTDSWDLFYAVEITSKSFDYKNIKIDSARNIGLIVWSEKNWISEEVLGLTDHVHVPMYGSLSSLNVSHAWAIVAYEIASKLSQ